MYFNFQIIQEDLNTSSFLADVKSPNQVPIINLSAARSGCILSPQKPPCKSRYSETVLAGLNVVNLKGRAMAWLGSCGSRVLPSTLYPRP